MPVTFCAKKVFHLKILKNSDMHHSHFKILVESKIPIKLAIMCINFLMFKMPLRFSISFNIKAVTLLNKNNFTR